MAIGGGLVLSEGTSVVSVVVDYDVCWSRGFCVGAVDQGNGPEEKHGDMVAHHQQVTVFQMPGISRGGQVHTTTWQKNKVHDRE